MLSFGHGFPFRNPKGSSSPPPWTPSDAGTILYQLDAEETNVLWQNTAGTVAAVAGGDPVQRWSATVGGNVTQSTAGVIPVLALSGSKKRVSFDGANDRLTNGTQSFTAGAKSLALCWKFNTTPTGSSLAAPCNLGLPATGGATRVLFTGPSHPSNGLNWNMDAPGASTTFVGTGISLDTAIHALVITYNGGGTSAASSYAAWLDGTPITPSVRASATTPIGTTSLGALSNGNNPGDIQIMHVLLWQGAISATNAVSACSYLLTRHT